MRRFSRRNWIFCFLGVFLFTCKAASYEVQEFTASTGKIDSTTKPEKYSPGDDKYFSINVTSGQKIKAEFTVFKLNGAFPNCSQDWVEIFSDCEFTSSLGKLCTTFQPFSLYTHGNCLGLKFHTKKQDSDSRFVLEYHSEDADKEITKGTPCSKGTVSIKSTGASASLLRSTGWPQNYPKDEQCTFEIVPPKDYKVMLYFLSLDMESNPTCELEQDIITVKVADTISTDVSNATEEVRLCQGAAYDKVWHSEKHYPKVLIDVRADKDHNVGRGYLIGYIIYTDKKDVGTTKGGGAAKPTQSLLFTGLLLCFCARYFIH